MKSETRCRSYQFKLSPTMKQQVKLERLLTVQCELYNAALKERREAWRMQRKSVSYFDQCKTLTSLKEVRPDALEYGVIVCRGTLKRLDRAFQAFYRRCQTGETPGYPRFKSVSRWNSAEWSDAITWKIQAEHKRLYLRGVGDIKVRLHRSMQGTPKTITVKRDGHSWWVTVNCTNVPAYPLAPTGSITGIDLGVTNLIATSNGNLITEGRFAKQASEKLKTAQQSLSRKQRGSNRRKKAVERVATCHRKVRNQRKDLSHQLSRQLVNDNDLIVHEDLKIRNMTKHPKPKRDTDGTYLPNGAAAKSGLNRSINDAGWGQLISMIQYKAESAGREVIAVNPQHTSQTCPECGHVDPGNRNEEKFQCLQCDHIAHADVNAAINILRAGSAQQLETCGGRK